MLRHNISRNYNKLGLVSSLRSTPRLWSPIRYGPTLHRMQFKRFLSNDERKPLHTKEQLLAQSRHFWDSLKIRFKWALIRQNRPFNMDEISAFISWIVMGNLLWFIIGTTTFVSLIFYSFDKFLNNQNARNRTMLKLLKFDTNNLTISIDKNFKINYKDGFLIFQNVNVNNFEIQRICLNLSFQKWHEGRGLIKELEVNGLRGELTIDQDSEFDMTNYFQSKNYELENFVIKDSIINFNGNNKLQIFHCQLDKLRNNWLLYDFFNCDNCNGAINDSLFTIHTKQVNRNYASFDELEKINILQQQKKVRHKFDMQDVIGSIFMRRKSFDLDTNLNQIEVQREELNKIIRFRIDELDLSKVAKPNNFQWIDSGRMELIADITFPPPRNSTRNDEYQITQELKSLITGVYENLTQTTKSIETNNENNTMKNTMNKTMNNNEHKNNDDNNTMNNDNNDTKMKQTQREYVMIDFKLQFKDLKLSYNNMQRNIDPDLVKFINNYNPDQNYQLITSQDLDNLILEDENTTSIFEQHDFLFQDHHHLDEISLPPITFRIIKNVEQMSLSDLDNTVAVELINNLNNLKMENDMRVKRYTDGSYLIKNLILVGLGVCLI